MAVEAESTRVDSTARLARFSRLRLARTTRAHLSLSRRPDFAERMREGLGAAAAAVGAQLGCAVSATARVTDAALLPEAGLGQGSAFALVELTAVGATAALELELPFLVRALERLSGGGSGKAAPATALTRIEEAAFSFLCLVALAELRGREGFQLLEPRLSAVQVGRGEALSRLEAKERHVSLELSLKVADAEGAARLLVPAMALQSALARVPPRPLEAISPEVQAAGFSCRTFMGHSRLTRAEARTLALGDVVLFEDLTLSGGRLLGPARLCAPGFALHGALGPQGFSPTGATSAVPQESKMEAEPLNEEVAAALPVDVEVELTRLRLSVGELAALKPGALLPLHMNVTEPVLLRVGDRAVARAELVEIDGEVGARILALLP